MVFGPELSYEITIDLNPNKTNISKVFVLTICGWDVLKFPLSELTVRIKKHLKCPNKIDLLKIEQ